MTYKIRVTSRSEREALIAKRLEASTEMGEAIYDFRSGIYTPKVISLPINIPVYRMENCRTFSGQQTEIAREGRPKDFFEKGQEQTTAQQAQHELLARLASEGPGSVTPIISVLREDGQREAILITSTGVVVNGNRRLSAMRELMSQSDGSVDDRFTHVRCAVLPPDVTADEIDDIEADLQARPQTKLDYDWVGDARLVRRQVDKGRSTKEVAIRLRRSKSEIENVLQALDEADLYLNEWIGKPGQYDQVQEGQQIFGDIPKNIAKKDSNLQDASRAIAWSIYENRDKVGGRVYRLNSAFGKLAPKVLESLEEQLEIEDDDKEDLADDDFLIDIESDQSAKDYSPIINALRSGPGKDDVVAILMDACENAIEFDKGKKNEQAALRALSQANAKITSIDVSLAGKNTLPGMMKQVKKMRAALDKIDAAIQMRQPSLYKELDDKE